jgi:hypothetical protein
LLCGDACISSASAQDNSRPVKAVQILGLPEVKENTKGTREVENTDLHFVHGKQSVDVSRYGIPVNRASSIESVSTGANSQAAVGETVSTLSLAAPYGSARALALFRTKINTLTIQYRDSAGTMHGDIFTLPTGTAETVKRELISQGAHTTPGQLSDSSTVPSVSLRKDEK